MKDHFSPNCAIFLSYNISHKDMGMRNFYTMQRAVAALSNLVVLIIVFLFSSSLIYAAKVVELNIKGPIGPATADYIVRTIDRAQRADLILILLDTPGGLDGLGLKIVR